MFDKLKKKIASKFNKSNSVERRDFSPLDLRLNSQVSITTNVPVIYDSLYNSCSAVQTVTAIGTFSVAKSKVFRFYFADNVRFLQIIVNATNEIIECRLFKIYQFIEPTSNKGWAEWLDDKEGKIGLFNFEIAGRDFIRSEAWADSADDRADPFSVRERVVSMTYDNGKYTNQKETKTDHEMMLYGRWLDEDNNIAEYIILSSDDEQIGTDTAISNIKICTGIDVTEVEINVI